MVQKRAGPRCLESNLGRTHRSRSGLSRPSRDRMIWAEIYIAGEPEPERAQARERDDQDDRPDPGRLRTSPLSPIARASRLSVPASWAGRFGGRADGRGIRPAPASRRAEGQRHDRAENSGSTAGWTWLGPACRSDRRPAPGSRIAGGCTGRVRHPEFILGRAAHPAPGAALRGLLRPRLLQGRPLARMQPRDRDARRAGYARREGDPATQPGSVLRPWPVAALAPLATPGPGAPALERPAEPSVLGSDPLRRRPQCTGCGQGVPPRRQRAWQDRRNGPAALVAPAPRQPPSLAVRDAVRARHAPQPTGADRATRPTRGGEEASAASITRRGGGSSPGGPAGRDRSRREGACSGDPSHRVDILAGRAHRSAPTPALPRPRRPATARTA